MDKTTQQTRDEDDSAVEQDADHPAGEGSGSPSDEAGRTGSERAESDDAAHLADVEDGCGCAEVWEHLSERRAADSD